MIKDIGTLNGPLLVFGGPYSNLEATIAILDKAKTLSIPPAQIICTGDITAYCGNPQETSQILQDSGIHIIQGNCDESLAIDSDDCACGFDDNSACEVLANKWYSYSKEQTNNELKKWMGTLPYRIKFKLGNYKFHVLHGSNSSINEFIFPSSDKEYLEQEIKDTNADVVIGGHSGMQFTSIIDNKVWHNPGVIGMPANDGTSRTWYALITEDNGKITFNHKILDYDYMKAAKTMVDNSLIEYAKTIETGLWPSLDVLPNTEKQKTGIAFQEETIIFEGTQ